LIVKENLARPERFELPTTWFEARYSIQLSYGRNFLVLLFIDLSKFGRRILPDSATFHQLMYLICMETEFRVKSWLFFIQFNQVMLRFIKATPKQLEDLLEHSTEEYAHEQYNVGEFSSMEKAFEESKREVYGYLQNEPNLVNHFIYCIFDQDTHVGYLWYIFEPHNQAMFLNYIYTFPEYRRRGYAQSAMQYFEMQALKRNCKECKLVVFKNNEKAIAMYLRNHYRFAYDFALFESKVPTRNKMVKRFSTEEMPE
jgi:ribosomal protein S18 acetylase RimI-like enzyme